MRITRHTGNFFLTNIHRVYSGDDIPASPDGEDMRDYFLGKHPTGATTDSKVDLGMMVRDIGGVAETRPPLRSADLRPRRVCVMRFRASDPLRGGRDFAGSRTGSSTTATGRERNRGAGRKGGRSDRYGW